LDKEIRDVAYEVYFSKGETSLGIANATARLVQAVLNDENVQLPVSVYLNGQYGLNNIYFGTPATIGKNGVSKVWELPLTQQEQESLQISYQILQSNYENLKESEANDPKIQSETC
jgi:L-lactate dehydrogenase